MLRIKGQRKINQYSAEIKVAVVKLGQLRDVQKQRAGFGAGRNAV